MELVEQSNFPDGMDIGSSYETIGVVAAGDAADWIMTNLSIPAAEAEIGSYDDFQKNGIYSIPNSVEVAKRILDENLGYIEKTYEKLGNEIHIEPLGYSNQNGSISLHINVTNLGLSDQIHDNLKLRFENHNIQI